MRTFAIKSRVAPAFGPVAMTPVRLLPAVHDILHRPQVQAKLRIGAVNDPAEREADHVADKVMRMPEPRHAGPVTAAAAPDSIQRLCADCAEETQHEPSDEAVRRKTREDVKEDDDERIRTKPAADARPAMGASAERTVHGLRGGGAPLPAAERAFFEPRFGRSFGAVRIHDGPPAHAAAQAIHARAFTLGNDIAFAEGELASGSARGRQLLAHELTHTVQQSEADAALVQRDVAMPPAGAGDAVVALTAQEIADAIAFNQARFSDPYSIRLIRDVVGLEPVPALVDADLVQAIVQWQAERHMTQDGKIDHTTTRSFFLEFVAEDELRDAVVLVMDSYAIDPGLNLQRLDVGGGVDCCGAAGTADAVTRDIGADVDRAICICRTSIPHGEGPYDHFVRIVLHEAVHVPQRGAGPADHDAREFDAFFAETCAGGRAPQLTAAQRVNHANIALAHFNAMPAAFRTPARTAHQAQLQALIAAGGVGPC